MAGIKFDLTAKRFIDETWIGKNLYAQMANEGPNPAGAAFGNKHVMECLNLNLRIEIVHGIGGDDLIVITSGSSNLIEFRVNSFHPEWTSSYILRTSEANGVTILNVIIDYINKNGLNFLQV